MQGDYPKKICVHGQQSRDLLKFFLEITDNILEIVQDEDVIATDH